MDLHIDTSSHFGGTDLLMTDPKNSRVTVIPVPYDATTSYIGGTSKGPSAIIDASAHMELYDRSLGMKPAGSAYIP